MERYAEKSRVWKTRDGEYLQECFFQVVGGKFHLFHAAAAVVGQLLAFPVTGDIFRGDATQIHVILGGEGIGKTHFCEAEGADHGLHKVCCFRVFLIVVTKPCIQLRVEVTYDASVAVSAAAQGFQQGLTVGVEQLEVAAL